MDAALGFTYIVIVCLWLVVLLMIIGSYRRDMKLLGGIALFFAVIAIDAVRNIIENTYFLTYFLSKFGYIRENIFESLNHSYIIIIPKLINVAAASLVIFLLLRRWLPGAETERKRIDDRIRQTSDALAQASEVRRALVEEHNRLLNFDPITGLPNRNRLQQDLSDLQAKPHAPIPSAVLALVVFEIDGYTEISHTLGETTSEALIRDIADRVSAFMKGPERCYWLGDGEFALVLPATAPDEVSKTVRALQKRLGERFETDEYRLFMTTSAGVALDTPNEGEDLLSQANLALRDARVAGGGFFRVYTPSLRAEALARIELEAELRSAFQKGQFVLHFQPQIRLRDDAVVGAEALLRWHHPERGVLSPASFLAALTRSPLAEDVGRWVLQTACEAAASWRGCGFPNIRVGVNLFPIQFRNNTLPRDIVAALASSGLPAEALEIEVTENISLDHDEATGDVLNRLKATGVRLAVDDFGTGYASLSYLARFPLDRIKIDKSFVMGISDASSEDDTAMARSIITMAHNLKLDVIAEGVETASQAAFLCAQGCDEAQGYLYAPALDEEQFKKLLLQNASNLALGPTPRPYCRCGQGRH
uniref:Bifunctional diguanylate cyclase/phosphodiesterase n=1 Tax=Bosea sp. NBC_00436 TaxID=2969620 RepID=A0A9E7ZIY0_9HYPH